MNLQQIQEEDAAIETALDQWYEKFKANGNKSSASLKAERQRISKRSQVLGKHQKRVEAEKFRQESAEHYDQDRRMFNNPNLTGENILVNVARRTFGINPPGLGAPPRGKTRTYASPAGERRAYWLEKVGREWRVVCNGRTTCTGTKLACEVHIDRNKRPGDTYKGIGTRRAAAPKRHNTVGLIDRLFS